MEVQCDRCQTEYDFDDALVSERGTTVKCTQCGHQFRIFRSKEAASTPERWVVRTREQTELVFTSLRDLQRAISRGQVERNDQLTREGLPPRTLGSIAELEPFFPGTDAPVGLARSVPPPPVKPRTLPPPVLRPQQLPTGDNSPKIQSAPPPAVSPSAIKLPPLRPPPASDVERMYEDVTVPRASTVARVELPVASTPKPLRDEPSREPQTQRKPSTSERPIALPPIKPPPVSDPTRASVPDDSVRAVLTPTPSDIRNSYNSLEESLSDARFSTPSSQRRTSSVRWIVALVVLGGLAVVGATVGRSYLTHAISPAASAPSGDPRIGKLLSDGERQLLDGDIEGAKENFYKASALAENSPAVLVQLARLSNVRADQAWLRLRLLPQDNEEVIRLTRDEVKERVRQALEASDRALQAMPNDATAQRVRLDSLRLTGDLTQAKPLLSSVSGHEAEPEVAYLMAGLEMTEPSPNWQNVVQRLRQAVSGEQNLGRARGALAYALVQAGQIDAAQAEFDTLSKAPRNYPLLLELKAFIARGKEVVAAGGAPSALPVPGTINPGTLPVAGGPAVVKDGPYQELLTKAHQAERAGQLDKAEQLYKAVLAKNPGDTEAIAGLGDVAKARGDKGGAAHYYEEVNKQNPSYLPALMGLADAKWDAGDKAGAMTLYRQVLERVGGSGPYAARARQRLSEGTGGAGASTGNAAAGSTGGSTEPTGNPQAPAPTETPAPGGTP